MEKVKRAILNNENTILGKQKRKWLTLNKKKHLRIMSFNILAESVVLPHQFKYHDLNKLTNKARYQTIVTEIEQIDPDILCCQEVDKSSVDLLKVLLMEKFDQCAFTSKDGMNKEDGSAIFFNSKDFQLKKAYYSDLFLDSDRGNYDKTDDLSVSMYYPGVAVYTVLEKMTGEDKGQNILIANTHILFNKNKGHIKFSTVNLVLKTIKAIKEEHGLKDVFFCGDFNLIPNSMIYEYITNGFFDMSCPWRQYSNQHLLMQNAHTKTIGQLAKMSDKKFHIHPDKKDKKVELSYLNLLLNCEVVLPKEGNNVTFRQQDKQMKLDRKEIELYYKEFSQSIGLSSSYSDFNKQFIKQYEDDLSDLMYKFDDSHNHDSFITHFAQDLVFTVDYIFYSRDGNYKVGQILQMPDKAFLNKFKLTCPVGDFGSDHFSIVADFEYKPE